MARIAGVDLPNDKRLEYGLTYIYGIGVKTAQKICNETGISMDIRVKDQALRNLRLLMLQWLQKEKKE